MISKKRRASPTDNRLQSPAGKPSGHFGRAPGNLPRPAWVHHGQNQSRPYEVALTAVDDRPGSGPQPHRNSRPMAASGAEEEPEPGILPQTLAALQQNTPVNFLRLYPVSNPIARQTAQLAILFEIVCLVAHFNILYRYCFPILCFDLSFVNLCLQTNRQGGS